MWQEIGCDVANYLRSTWNVHCTKLRSNLCLLWKELMDFLKELMIRSKDKTKENWRKISSIFLGGRVHHRNQRPVDIHQRTRPLWATHSPWKQTIGGGWWLSWILKENEDVDDRMKPRSSVTKNKLGQSPGRDMRLSSAHQTTQMLTLPLAPVCTGALLTVHLTWGYLTLLIVHYTDNCF